MFTMSYKTTYPNKISITHEIDTDDITLTELFAYFVEMTREMGYHVGSYDNILKEISECDDNYPIDVWASEIVVEHAMREKDDFGEVYAR